VKNSEDCVSTLCELGLSISQAKIYLSLVKFKKLKAQEIASISGVARPYVYGILTQLEDAGLVEKTITKPEEFHAISIEKCVSHLIQRRIIKTAELQQKALTLTENLKRNIENEELSKEFNFILIQNRDAVYAKAENMLKSVEKIICFIALKRRLLAWISNYFPLLKEALIRKVDFRIILAEPAKDQYLGEPIEALMMYPNFDIRLISESPNVGFSVWERKEILLSTSLIDTPFPHPTLWSNNESIVTLSQNYFDLLWQRIENKNEKRKIVIGDTLTFT
jgi:sugar-specific transcriptional regulator TrmB